MAIGSVCNTDVVTIIKSSTLKDVSVLMQKKHVGSVVVVESLKGKWVPCGIITDRDLALTIGTTENSYKLPVEKIMRKVPVTVNAKEGIFQTILKMKENGVKRMPVLESDGSLLGIVSSDDLMSLMGEEINNLSKVTEAQIKIEKGIRTPPEKNVVLTA